MDTLDYTYGAALSQKQDDGKFHPVGFMSKSMVPAEQNYDAYDKEALGIVKPLQHWHYWLQGAKKPIEIITNHKNLLSGFNDKATPSKRHLRWLEILKGYNYVVGYQAGSRNTVTDTLSQRPDHYPSNEEPIPFNPFPEDKMKPLEEIDTATLSFAQLCLVESDGTCDGIDHRRRSGVDPTQSDVM
jgi:hypothetical protein